MLDFNWITTNLHLVFAVIVLVVGCGLALRSNKLAFGKAITVVAIIVLAGIIAGGGAGWIDFGDTVQSNVTR